MKQIDHYRSVHTTGIQKSQYLMIEDDPRVIKSYLKHNHDKNYVHNEKEADEYNHICKEPELCLKYCHELEVYKKRNKNLVFKAKFLQKIYSIRSSGKRLEILKMVDEWLEENIDELYQNTLKSKSKGENDTTSDFT